MTLKVRTFSPARVTKLNEGVLRIHRQFEVYRLRFAGAGCERAHDAPARNPKYPFKGCAAHPGRRKVKRIACS
jgi:hypothetical protein